MLSAQTFLYNLAFCCMYWGCLKPCYSMGLQRYLWPKFYPFSYKFTPDCMYSIQSVTCYFATQVTDSTPVLPTPQCHYTVPLVNIQSDQKVSVHLMITIQSSGAQRLFDHPVLQSLKLRLISFVIQYTSWKHDNLSNISFQAFAVGATQVTVFWVITQRRIIHTVAPQHSGSLGPRWSQQLWDNYSREFSIQIIITLHHHHHHYHHQSSIFLCRYPSRKRNHKVAVYW